MTESASLETREEAVAIGGEAKYWQMQLELAEQDHRDWIKDGKAVVQRYKGEREKAVKANSKRFNVLYSNVETLKAAVFARMAKPDVRRRFADRDALGRQVAEIVERAQIYCNDSHDAEREFEAAIEDYLLPGRGIVKVCYEAESAPGEDGEEYVARQALYAEHVAWDDFRHEPARKWAKVTWVAFRHLMARAALEENFGAALGADAVKKIPLDWSPRTDGDRLPDAFKRAEVWEIWDKATRTRVWVVNGFPDLLRKDADPYGLESFFPVAEPLQAVAANDTLIPSPEFHVYKDQADGLDEIEARIDRLTRALKRRGVYDATFKELASLSKAADNQFVPVKNYAELSQKGGLAAAFQSEDIGALAKVLASLHQQRDLRVQTIYEVVGIADIMRGASDPRETFGAQRIKAQFGGSRLRRRQEKIQRWIRDTLRIAAELIAEHFEPQTLAEMTGFALGEAAIDPATGRRGAVDGLITPQMMQILRSDKLRSYRIDVETDSTMFDDAEAERERRIELIKSLSEFVAAWLPVVQAQPALLPLAFELLSFGVRGFKAGRQLEESIDQARAMLEQAAAQPRGTDPRLAEESAKAQLDAQLAVLRTQAEITARGHELEIKGLELGLKREEIGLQRQAMQNSVQTKPQLSPGAA